MMTQSYTADTQAHTSGISAVGLPQKESTNADVLKLEKEQRKTTFMTAHKKVECCGMKQIL